jgi:predicted amidohydrolase
MKATRLILAIVVSCSAASAEDLVREGFDGPARPRPLTHTWGDRPAEIKTNATEPKAGVRGGAARLRVRFDDDVRHKLSYWTYKLPQRVPLIPQVEGISFRVKANVPVSIKIGISPYGFIYHGPAAAAGDEWQQVSIADAYAKLRKWCEGGKKTADRAWVQSVIVAVRAGKGAEVDVAVDDIAVTGPPGAAAAARKAAFARRTGKVRVAAISLVWDRGHRTLANALEALDEAALAGADLACLPAECVHQAPETIPGPAANAIAARAARHKMNVVACLRERDGARVYVTSFLCDRSGRIVGKYRKSHRLPFEEGIALGDDLPVFATDVGPIGLKIGTDHHFPEIDGVLRRRGAKLVVWSTMPLATRDEHTQTLALRGRAATNRLHYAVARYAGKEGYGGYPKAFSWQGTWPIGRAQVLDTDGHTLADSGHAGGVAVATIPAERLAGSIRNGGYPTSGKFALLTASDLPKPRVREPGMKRTIRAAAIECEPNIDRLMAKLDACGEAGCDVVCLWEYVWYRSDEEVARHRDRNRRYLARIADAARRHRMYVVIAGELERGFNEAIVFDRRGKELGRYTKINQTTAKTSRFYRAGEKVGIFDVDFGRICTKICADVYSPEIDRIAALHQVDLMLLSTQDAGPFTEHTRLRDHHRCVDNGYFLLRAAGQSAQADHRTYIMGPWGMMLAGTQFRTNNEPVIATLQLDNRPKYYEWPEKVRKSLPYPDPYKRGLRPVARGDLRAVVLRCRRPELYRPRPAPKKE